MKLLLVRQYFDTHTFGVLYGLPKILHTIERPWQDNARQVSCIPAGVYRLRWREAPWSRFPFAFEVTNVPNRAGILIHSANLARQLQGCIAPGLNRGFMKGEPAVLSSIAAVSYLESNVPKQGEVLLEIAK